MPVFTFFYLTLWRWHPPYNSGKSIDLAVVPHPQWEKGTPGSQGTETSAPEQSETGRDWELFNSQQKKSGKEHRRKSGVQNGERWGDSRGKGRGEACQTGWKPGENRRVKAGQNVCIRLRAGSMLSSLKKDILRHWKNSIFITALMTFPLSTRFCGEIHLQGNFFLSAVRRPDKETQLNVLFSAMQMLFHNTNKINIFLWDTKFSESWVYLWRFLAMLCLVAKIF